eukprot:12953678-Ditylum_brightwellii.AAC.1
MPPPFLLYGKTKKQTKNVSKGTLRADHSKDGKLSLWYFVDSSLAFVLDSIWVGTIEDFTGRNKATGASKCIGQGPKARNDFDSKIYGVDCWDLTRCPNSKSYLIEMHGRQCKWTVHFDDGMIDV